MPAGRHAGKKMQKDARNKKPFLDGSLPPLTPCRGRKIRLLERKGFSSCLKDRAFQMPACLASHALMSSAMSSLESQRWFELPRYSSSRSRRASM